MARIIAIDFGRKRCGIAATDTMQIVANGLCTIPTAGLNAWVKAYVAREPVERIVVGLPVTLRGEPSESQKWLRPAIDRLRREIPDMPVEFFDERFTSAIAHRAMIDGGLSRMARRDKALVDEISATIILNDYLESRQYKTSK
ncbi:MAG: Holliday junction resolvase RuvX [Muribaculaceae bacterium]|nr:Holliday junction resolvase RuvX [Muribaculaceae bacterium]MDE6486493.1 Holliday junction resolvase RuvX [Muribaculaceae bacterium]